ARLIRSASDQLPRRPKTPFQPSWESTFRWSACRLCNIGSVGEHVSIFRGVRGAFAVPQCDKSTSFPNVVSTALNITLEARRTACFNHAHEHDPHRSPPRQAVRCKGDCGNA